MSDEAQMTTNLTNPKYVHCDKCVSTTTGPYAQHIEVRVEGTKLEVWCAFHDKEIATFKLSTSVNYQVRGEER